MITRNSFLMLVLLHMSLFSLQAAHGQGEYYCGDIADLIITNGGCACGADFSYNKVLSGPGLTYNFQVGSSGGGLGWCTNFTQPTNENDRVACVDGTLRVTVNVYGVTHNPSGMSCPDPPLLTVFPTGPTCSLDSAAFCSGFREQTHDTGIRCNAACPNLCQPSNGITRAQCERRIPVCAGLGSDLKWTGKGCRTGKNKPLRDGGCQCKGYCGFKCKGACNSDSECRWQSDGCYVKATGHKGVPIPVCNLANR